MAALSYSDAVSEALERLRPVGFEHGRSFVNHAPMAAEALAHMGYADEVPAWVERNLRSRSYHDVPERRWPIDPDDPADWQSALGDFSRVADWTALFERELALSPWTEVLARWWPRLLPGLSAVLTHGVIRTAHAVRAVAATSGDNRLQLGELAQGLGYWAARHSTHGIVADIDGAPGPDGLPGPGADAGPHARHEVPDGRHAVPDGRDEVARALDALVAEYAGIYATVSQRHPVPLIHAVTGPAAVRLVVGHLPPAQRRPSYLTARAVSRTMLDWFHATPRPAAPLPADTAALPEVFARAVEIGDEHTIKLAEVAVRHEAFAPDPRHAAAAHTANRAIGRLSR
ncbi:questin oxidase family protein [Streptomyces salinarius]|uniref:questin oxidase family protein n=1 Tax=Streptomyces salinarius TaxID=2762598 RepID=UPI0013D99763|nr:questin oxidase family protein [Streptomyces salinarius]